MKRIISVFIIVCMAFTVIAVMPGSDSQAYTKKNGYYCFVATGSSPVTCKITKNYITIKKKSGIYMDRGQYTFYCYPDHKLKASKKFKLAKKIYVFHTEYPSHVVEKFNTEFLVSHGKYYSKSKFYKKKRNKFKENIALYLIVKKGKVVAIGNSAGSIDPEYDEEGWYE